jgi:hypothetical protein
LSEENVDFEEGKQVEEYFDPEKALEELNHLNVEEEAETVPESKPVEPIVQPTEKPQKKKKEPQPTVASAVIVQSPPTQATPEQPSTTPQEQQNVPEQEPQSEPQQEVFLGIDDFIQKQCAKIEEEYTKQGKIQSQRFRENSYRNLVAVITGQARIVPVEQEPQPQPQQEPMKPVDDTAIVLHRIDLALKDPAFKGDRKALLKLKCNLLGVEFDDLLPPEAEPAKPHPEATPQPQNKPPVDPKLVKPPKKKWSFKKTLACGIISLVVAVSTAYLLSFILSLLS